MFNVVSMVDSSLQRVKHLNFPGDLMALFLFGSSESAEPHWCCSVLQAQARKATQYIGIEQNGFALCLFALLFVRQLVDVNNSTSSNHGPQTE